MIEIDMELVSKIKKKLKEAGTNPDRPKYTKGWFDDESLGTGSIEKIELKPQIKKLIKNCRVPIILDPVSDPCYTRDRLTKKDQISLPWPQQFDTEEGWHRVLFHELAHWTGHEDRLDREMGQHGCCKFHSLMGSVEELTAELSSTFLAGHFGFVPNYDRASDYISNYLGHVTATAGKDGKELVQLAGKQAAAATKHLLSLA